MVLWLVLVLAACAKASVLCRHLVTMNLNGTIPPQLSSLKELQFLYDCCCVQSDDAMLLASWGMRTCT